MNFTHEQEPAINSLARIVKLVAFAGTGKTTTLVGYAKARPQCRLLYLCCGFHGHLATHSMSI